MLPHARAVCGDCAPALRTLQTPLHYLLEVLGCWEGRRRGGRVSTQLPLPGLTAAAARLPLAMQMTFGELPVR